MDEVSDEPRNLQSTVMMYQVKCNVLCLPVLLSCAYLSEITLRIVG